MHLDILDTVLVSRKNTDGPRSGDTAKQPPEMKHSDTAPDDEAKCPVDHKTRATWLNQARAASGEAAASSSPTSPSPHDAHQARLGESPSAQPPTAASSSTWRGWSIPFFSRTTPSEPSATAQQHGQSQPTKSAADGLPTERQVSSIPRSSNPGPSSCPANHESETPADAETGNWIYPSERQFFDAMRRKGFTSQKAADMRTVVPIHNAVNERAWAEIRAWESPYAGSCAGGPRLHSFAGDSKKMTPRARLNTLLGYTAPFDRHDWVVDRCGTRVEYVIDFYAGRQDKNGDGKVNFYLDVRPKLNSWEGVKMRFMKGVGLA